MPAVKLGINTNGITKPALAAGLPLSSDDKGLVSLLTYALNIPNNLGRYPGFTNSLPQRAK
jgi:hypothetical protein